MRENLSKTKEALLDIAAGAGSLLIEMFESATLDIKMKADHSPVTKADIAAQDFILTELSRRFPRIPIVSEELEAKENLSSMVGDFFIVDPLDSTKNFVARIPFFDVSIALVRDGMPIVGVVRDPIHSTSYSAVRGKGAWKNSHAIRVRGCDRLEDADLDINVAKLPADQYRRVALKVVPAAKKVRYFGSAVIEGCWVACGMIDGVINHRLSAWDLAAVTLIIDEAGGCWGDLDGTPYRLDTLNQRPFFAFGTRRLMDLIVDLVMHD